MMRCLLVAALAGTAAALYPKGAKIDNTAWNDTDGNFIHAHGGQIVEYNDMFYLIGTTQKTGSGALSEGINCYSSVDLMNWKFENEIFHNTSVVMPSGTPPWRIERPKIVINEQNNNFVMWFHLDMSNFAISSVGVATASSICGDYEFVSGFKPDGLDSYDMGLYQDGTDAYLVRSVQNQYAGISKLTPDYLNTTGISSKGPRMEGVTIFKLDTYYLFGSHLTGWSPNPAQLCTTPSTSNVETAVWDNNAAQCNNPTSSSTTYNSQSTYVVRFEDTINKKYSYMYMGDIWNAPNVGQAYYLWLPLVFNSTAAQAFPTMPNLSTWTLGDYEVDMP